MNNKLRLLIIIFCLPITIFFVGLIGLILRLISVPSVIIAFVIIIIITNKKGTLLIKKLVRKIQYYIDRNQYQDFIPKSKSDAARKSLKSIDKLTTLIQNNIAAEGLRYEKQRVEKELLRGDLLVVVFGAGSTGKTSLIRALLDKIVGNVGAKMGSTTKSNSYRLHLKQLKRGIRITDTPGIEEGGIEGRLREKDSLMYASRADLIIFVIDCDLRSYEMEILTSLSNIGKKILIVLNKCDLRGTEEVTKLLSLLSKNCRGIINEKDIIATSASPQTIPIIGSYPQQPKPEVNQLIRRMANILHQEGEELIADNILLQCKNLGESGKKLLAKQRLIEAKSCIERYVWISSGVILITPLPGIDLLGAAVVNGRMVMDISKIYGIDLTKERSKELARSVAQTLAGLGIVKGGVSLISNSLTLHLPTYLIGKTVQSITAAWLTKVAGESFLTYFQQDQCWGDGGIQEVVQRHYNLNRRESSLKRFVNAALNRVIKPGNESRMKQLAPHQMLQEEEASWDPENQEE